MVVKKDKLIIFHEGTMECEIVQVEDLSEETIQSKRGMYALDDVTKHLDIRNGNLVYMVKADIPARVEAQKLRDLRRSVALKRMFEFNTKDGTDFKGFIPWIVIILLILFK
ncbi:hypothetical protein A8L34_29555 [Bacillus sp. FJAT-27264]|uniref:hypothetical protein n=1 Tax=Paenibacillus sp. (strain DSM 101736 / FJAT-27264) TaxID=1850362 RepID=UPI000807E6FC|nr:hypothetical protein [Bacillus sp. FJAT-27264]OBZ15206.1 hypothetical protein A8L34_29555 [Bacillus sp. FJAT-27264]